VVPICTKTSETGQTVQGEIDHKLQCFASRGIPVLNLLGVPSFNTDHECHAHSSSAVSGMCLVC
jgi:hypothetical protein